MRAAAYVRVSTHTQATDGLSLADQKQQIGRHAEAKGWELVGEYVDAVSGRKESRPQLDKMRADAKRGRFDFLIVNRLDRLGRNNRHLHNLLHELEQAGVQFVCLNPDIDTSTTQGRLQLGVLASVAEFESDMTSERIKPVLKGSAERGKHHARPPFGYMSKDKELVPHPEQAPVVRRIFEEKAAGATQRAMAGRLNAEGIKTATGARWDPSNIGKVLANRTYIGEIKSNGDVFPGKHVAIISDELWGIVQTLKATDRAAAGKGRGRVPAKHLFVRGHLRCGLCGGAMVPRTKGRNSYYQCQARKALGPAACTMGNVPRKPLDEAAWEYFASVGIDREATRERELEAANEQRKAAVARLTAAKKAAREAVANQQRIRDQFKHGQITPAEWREWKDELARDVADSAARVAELELAAEADSTQDDNGQDAVLARLAIIRMSVIGSFDSDENVAAARAGVRRMFESFRVAPVQARMTEQEIARLIADLRARRDIAEQDIKITERAFEADRKTRRWVVIPEPKLELVAGSGEGIGWRPVLKQQQGDKRPLPIVADTVQFLDSPGERSHGGDGDDAGTDRSAGELVGVGAGDETGESVF